MSEPEDSIKTRQSDTGDDRGCLELLQFLHELTLTHSCASICRHHLAHKHMHTRAHTNLVFGRGAAAVLGQVQHGSVALKAGRAVEPVLKNQTPCIHTDTHTDISFRLLDLWGTWTDFVFSIQQSDPGPKLSLTLLSPWPLGMLSLELYRTEGQHKRYMHAR